MTSDGPNKMVKTHPKLLQHAPILVPKWPQNDPTQPQIGSKIGSKNGQMGIKGAKIRSKVIWTFIKVHKILKIHSGCLQTHPFIAHFHRLKRRFHCLFFKQNKSFIAEKRFVSAQFCIFLVNFSRNLHHFCLFFHYFFA